MTETRTENPGVRYEKQDFPPGPVLLGLALLAGGLAMIFLMAGLTYDLFMGQVTPANASQAPRPEFAPMRPDIAAWSEQQLRVARQRAAGYGWVDRRADLVHIPVERAMDLMLMEGFPQREGGALTAEPGREISPPPSVPPVVFDPRGEESPR